MFSWIKWLIWIKWPLIILTDQRVFFQGWVWVIVGLYHSGVMLQQFGVTLTVNKRNNENGESVTGWLQQFSVTLSLSLWHRYIEAQCDWEGVTLTGDSDIMFVTVWLWHCDSDIALWQWRCDTVTVWLEVWHSSIKSSDTSFTVA